MENLILSKLENLKINNNNKNFYNRDKELYKFLLSKDFYDQVFKTLKINIPEDIKIFLINDLINQISEKKIKIFDLPLPPSCAKHGLPPFGGKKKNYFDESSLDINSLLKDYLVSLPKEPKGSCPRREARPSSEGRAKQVDKKPFVPVRSTSLRKQGQEFISTKNLIQEYILEEGFSYILGCIWKNENIKTEYDNKLEFLNSKKKFLSSLSSPFAGEDSIDSVSYLSPALLFMRSTERSASSPLEESRVKKNLLLSFLHSKKKKDEIEYNLFCKETHTILKAIKEKFYNIDWLIEGKLCFIKSLPRAKHLPLLSVLRTVVGDQKEKNKYSLKTKKRKDIVCCFARSKGEETKHFPPLGGTKVKRLDIFYNYIEKRIEPGQFTSLLRKMINKRYKNIFFSSLRKEGDRASHTKEATPSGECEARPLDIKMKGDVRSKAKTYISSSEGKKGNIFLQRNSAPSAEKERNKEISQIKVFCKSRVENKPSCASLLPKDGQENPSLDINYSSLKYRLIDIYLSIFDLFIFSLKKEYNSLIRYMSYMGRVFKEGKYEIGKKGSRSREKVEGSTDIKMLQEQVFSPASFGGTGDQASSQKSFFTGGRCEKISNRVSCKEEYKIRDLPSGFAQVKSNSFLPEGIFFNPCEARDQGICISNHFSIFYKIYIIYLQFFEIGKNKNFMILPILYKDFFIFFDLWKESLKVCLSFGRREAHRPSFRREFVQRKRGERAKHLEGKKVFSNLNILILRSCAKHFPAKAGTSDFIYFPINSNIKVDIIYYRFGLDFLIGIYGNYKTSQNLYRQIEDFLSPSVPTEENYYLSLEKHNLYNPSSPEKHQTIFRNYQISFLEWKQYYKKIQSLTLYMGKNVKGNPSFLTRFCFFREEEKGYSKFKYKISLNLPLLDIIRSLHKEGFCDGKGFPTSKKNWTILSDSRILKYFKNLLYSLRKYYSIIDYPKNWKKIEYILQHSCTMTIAHKHRTSLRKVLTFYGKKMRLNTDHK